MRKRKPIFEERRVLNAFETAAYLGRSVGWLTDHANSLYNADFPRPLPVVGGYDRQAIDAWLDSLGNRGEQSDFGRAWTKAANG